MWVVVKMKVPFLGTLNNRCRIIMGTQKGTTILTTTHVVLRWFAVSWPYTVPPRAFYEGPRV